MTNFEKLMDVLDDHTYCLARNVLLEYAGRDEYVACAERALTETVATLTSMNKAGLVAHDETSDTWQLTLDAATNKAVDANAVTTTCVRYSAIRHLTETLKKGA